MIIKIEIYRLFFSELINLGTEMIKDCSVYKFGNLFFENVFGNKKDFVFNRIKIQQKNKG